MSLTAILLLSHNASLLENWQDALSAQYNIKIATGITEALLQENPYELVILDSQLIDQQNISFGQLKQSGIKLLLVGEQWPEQKQIDALVTGASGYCEFTISPALLMKAAETVLNGEIWIQRHLIPKVIGSLVQLSSSVSNTPPQELADMDIVKNLSARELDVAKLIRSGKSNKRIASALNISERTVKAHLTSIFRKMEVADRLHLAVSLKGLDI